MVFLWNSSILLSVSIPGDVKPHFPELHQPGGKNAKNKKNKSSRVRCAFQPMKSPCLALNELKPGIEYKVLSQDGPVR